MADLHRLDASVPEAADRDSRTEALLVDGLDRYFAGRYDDAIHLWTRVLFLDRSHARARAYIDRARTAIAERQRRADEMLQAAADLLAAGQTAAARESLGRAMAAAGDDDRAAEVRARIERVERAQRAPTEPPRLAVVDAVPVASASWWRPLGARGVLVMVAVAAIVTVWAARRWLDAGGAPTPLPPVARQAALPVLSSSEAALVRARTLYARGRLADALRALDRVDADGPGRPDADRLRAEIQQLLLATGRDVALAASPDRGRP